MKVFLDSNIYVVGRENQETNCHIILKLAMERYFQVVGAFLTLKEVREYFKRAYGKDTGWLMKEFIVKLPDIIIGDESKLKKQTEKIKKETDLRDEDATLLAVAQENGVDYFVSLNRHFLKGRIKNPEVLNPAQFLKRLGFEPLSGFE